jgi:hypothetical protein
LVPRHGCCSVGSLGKAELLGLGILRQSFPKEARVTPVELLIDSAVSLFLLNLEAAQQERSMLLSEEQKLLMKEGKKGVCIEHQNGFL